jgi:hypothetical protein
MSHLTGENVISNAIQYRLVSIYESDTITRLEDTMMIQDITSRRGRIVTSKPKKKINFHRSLQLSNTGAIINRDL